jgi:hypothetical protein
MFLKFLRKKAQNRRDERSSGVNQAHGVDPEMYYCLSCGAEFRMDVALCPSCRTALISGSEKLAQLERDQELHAGRSMEILPGVELVSIRKGPLRDMKYLQKVLEQDSIPALISGDENGCAKGCCGPEMFLQIRKDDVGSALEILAKDFVRSTALESQDLSNASAVFDPTDLETQCPACGSKFSPSIGACPDCGLCFE